MDIWETLSASLVLLAFCGLYYFGAWLGRRSRKAEESASERAAKHGVSYADGKVTVKTDRREVTREEQVARSADAINVAASKVASRPDAFHFGGKASGVESPSRGFQRTKKLD